MTESAALLVDEVLPAVPIRRWVLSFHYQLRLLLAQQPEMIGKALEIVYRTLATHLIRKARFYRHSAQTGAVTLIQRFGSALDLNVHFHMLFLDGVYAEDQYGAMRFYRVKAPTREELGALVHQLSQRVSRYLEKKGWLQRDMENTYLLLDDDDALLQLQGYSVTYRIAIGAQAGRKVLRLQSLPPAQAQESARVAKQAGFSLHAGVMADSHQKELRERLCRYISRPAVSEKRLALTSHGKVRYELKTPYRDGTTHVYFEPLDFIARLAALIPKPRVNLTRFHGLFVRGGLPPNSKHRALVTPGKRGKGRKPAEVECVQDKTIEERRNAMTWMQRLKRVFNIDIEQCERCGGHVKVVACIEDPAVIEKILKHLALKESPSLSRVNDARGPPDQPALFRH